MREEAAELGDALADTVGPVDAGRADAATGPEVLLSLASAETHLECAKMTFRALRIVDQTLKVGSDGK